MSLLQQPVSTTFQQFFDSEKSSGILLIICTLFSLVMTNSAFGSQYLNVWRLNIGGLSLAHWINDALMAIFFLLIGLELEREICSGELSDFKNALLPIFEEVPQQFITSAETEEGRDQLLSFIDSVNQKFKMPEIL